MGVSVAEFTCSAHLTAKDGRERCSEEDGGNEARWDDGGGRTKLRARSGREGSDGRERAERVGRVVGGWSGELWGVRMGSDAEGSDRGVDEEEDVDGTVEVVTVEMLLPALLDA